MKKVFLLALIASAGMLRAQIFIDTGNENLEKFKNENPNIEIYNEEKQANQPPKATYTPNETTPQTPSAPVALTPSAPPVADADFPPNAQPGKCYARCIIPDQFEFREEQIIDKPAKYKTETTPATYGIVLDTVMLKQEYVKTVNVSAQYDIVSDDVLVKPATTKWEKGKADASCLSANPADCQVWCLVEVPAVYKKVTRKVLVNPATTREEVVPAQFKTVEKKVMIEPAKSEKVLVEAATYRTVMRKIITKEGGYQEWREVLCANQLNEQRILAIQKALQREGYNPGPLDNVFGTQTKEALIKFQQDKGLPIGNLNMETLKALAVD